MCWIVQFTTSPGASHVAYLCKNLSTFHKTIQLMADICYPVLSEHKDRDIMALRRCRNCLNDYEDVFQIHFICCAITAVCRCVISAEQMARIPDCRRKQSGAISHEMTLVRGELCAPLHSDCSVQHLSAQYKRTGYNCTLAPVPFSRKANPRRLSICKLLCITVSARCLER